MVRSGGPFGPRNRSDTEAYVIFLPRNRGGRRSFAA